MKRTVLTLASLVLAAASAVAAPCNSSTTALCLSGGRFELNVTWKDFQGHTGDGQAAALTADTGTFWFFSSSNIELVVKVLDGRALNGHFWVFYGALSNVEYELTVRDSQTGDVRVYENPSGQFASAGDTLAFPPDSVSLALASPTRARPVGHPVDESTILPATGQSQATCAPGATALCLAGGRFHVEAAWKDFQGHTGAGQAVPLTGDTGYFWFFSSTNVEAVVKVLDARAVNDHFWVFYGALSNVEYTLTVTDTVTGIVQTYQNPSGLFASVGDTLAFGKPTTFQLIDGAVVKGEIDGETALLDKVYAFFGDARLPPAYQGDPPGAAEHGILCEVADRWATLSLPTQQALEPFLTPPIYASSWAGQASAPRPPGRERSEAILADWTRIPTTRAVVWYRAADAGSQTAAANIAAEIENVWSKESGLMHHEPLTDAGRTNNGGDGKLDIYLLPNFRDPRDANAGGVASPYPGQDSATPRAVYILIRISAASTLQAARATLAHEFFHAIAATYKNGFNGWLNEATATWMEDYVYPREIGNVEHNEASRYLTGGYKRPFDQPDDRGYGDYLFLFYLARSIPSAPAADVNRRIWDSVATMSPLQAIETNIPGGFAESWPEFALYCWNHPDIDKFQQWDSLATTLVEGNAEPYIGLASGNGTSVLPARAVKHLSIAYAFVDVADDTIKRIEIQVPPLAAGGTSARLQVWYKLANGTAQVDDWTGKSRVVFCRDKAAENVTKLLLLYTNGNPVSDDVVFGGGKVLHDAVGCGGFRGTVHETGHATFPAGSADETMDVTAKFLPDPLLADHYYLAQITMRASGTGHETVTNCTLTIGPATRTVSFQYGEDSISEIVIDKSTNPAGYSAEGNFGFIADAKGECPGQPGGTVQTGVGGEWLRVPAGGFFRVNADGSLSGDYAESAPGVQKRWTWNFQRD